MPEGICRSNFKSWCLVAPTSSSCTGMANFTACCVLIMPLKSPMRTVQLIFVCQGTLQQKQQGFSGVFIMAPTRLAGLRVPRVRACLSPLMVQPVGKFRLRLKIQQHQPTQYHYLHQNNRMSRHPTWPLGNCHSRAQGLAIHLNPTTMHPSIPHLRTTLHTTPRITAIAQPTDLPTILHL